MQHAVRSVLAIDASPFGRSLGLIPAMRAFRGAYPRTYLVAAAATGTCQLLTAAGLVGDVVDLGVIKSADGRHAGALKRFVALARRSRRYSFDLILDFSPRLETQIVSRLLVRGMTIAPARLPWAVELLLTFGDARQAARRSHSEDYESVLRQAGVEAMDWEIRIVPSPEDNQHFERLLLQHGSRGGELLVLLYSSDPKSRRGWPVEAFGEIGSRLANNFGARVVVADEPSDRTFTAAVARFVPEGSLKLAAPQALELIAAIARASIVVTDDDAIARLASGVGTPVIEVTDSQAAATAGSRVHRVMHGASRGSVSPDEVYETASAMIQESRSPSLFDRS